MAHDTARDLDRGLLFVAAFIIADTLCAVPVILFAATGSSWLWPFVAVWAVVSAAMIAAILIALRRTGRRLIGPLAPMLLRVLAPIAGLTIAFVLAAVWRPGWTPLWLVLYLTALAVAVGWAIRWQAANYSLRCTRCGHRFDAPAARWAFAINMGAYKGIACPACGNGWSEIIRCDGPAG